MDIRPPVRVSRSWTQHLQGPPAAVIPLLCPVREADWIEGWDPLVVWSSSGVAEPDCAFVTPGESHPATWYITRHEPDAGVVEMLKFTPDVTVARIRIEVREAPGGSEPGGSGPRGPGARGPGSRGPGSRATVTYTHTSLGPAGDAFVAGFTEAYYERFMRDWEARMNHFLEHGRRLEG
jgi:hypothetical protein